MAMLEVHDGHGRVQRVPIARDQTVLFGSSPQCDIVLDDPEVLPFHGRLRWRRDQIKVDASPEAEFIELNGRKMASASFRQGDELQLGSCRIFLISGGIEVPRPAESPRARRRRAAAPAVRRPIQRTQATASDEPAGVEAPLIAEDFALEPEEKLDDLEIIEDDDGRDHRARGRADAAGRPPVPAAGRRRRSAASPCRALAERGSSQTATEKRPASISEAPGVHHEPTARRMGWGRLIRALRSQDLPPGEERIFSSPLVVTLLIALVFLLLASGSLWGIIQADDRHAALQPGRRQPERRRLPQRPPPLRRFPQPLPRRFAGEQGAGPPRPGQRPPVHHDHRRLVDRRPGGRA